MPKANPVEISLIVGLGNPGSQYEHTRHNVGVDFLEMIADKYKMIVDDDNLKYNSFEILWGMGDEQSQENRSSRTVY